MKRTVALLRAREDAERSAANLSKRGFDSAIAPVLKTVSLAAPPPVGSFDAVLATSARAFELASDPVLASARALPLFLVGERSAAAAVARGFSNVASPALDAVSLAKDTAARLAPASRLLYLAGRDRKRDLEEALRASGHYVETLEVYEARAREAWRADEIAALAGCAAALHYSRRSAELACLLARRSGLADSWRNVAHICISEEAAAPLHAFGARRVYVAALAREQELFDRLAEAIPN